MVQISHGISEVCLEGKGTIENFEFEMQKLLGRFTEANQIARELSHEKKQVEKYDRFLNDDLLNLGYSNRYLDLEGAKNWFAKIKSKK
jgi:hypothetical protein